MCERVCVSVRECVCACECVCVGVRVCARPAFGADIKSHKYNSLPGNKFLLQINQKVYTQEYLLFSHLGQPEPEPRTQAALLWFCQRATLTEKCTRLRGGRATRTQHWKPSWRDSHLTALPPSPVGDEL